MAIKATFWDAGGPFRVVAADYASDAVTPGGQDARRTATVTLPAKALDRTQIGDTAFVVEATTDADATARLVRVIRLAPPAS